MRLVAANLTYHTGSTKKPKNSLHFGKSLQVKKRLVKGKGLEAKTKLRNNYNSLTNTTNQENLLICLHKLSLVLN